MRISSSAFTALLVASSGPLALVSANISGKAASDTVPSSTTSTTTSTSTSPVSSSTSTSTSSSTTTKSPSTPGLLSALYRLASTFNLRSCIPGALPLAASLPKIPPALLAGGDGAAAQALTQTHRALEDVCEFSVTGEAGAAFTSYLPAWYAWFDENRDRIGRLVEKCPEAGGLVLTVEAFRGCEGVEGRLRTEGVRGTGEGGSVVSASVTGEDVVTTTTTSVGSVSVTAITTTTATATVTSRGMGEGEGGGEGENESESVDENNGESESKDEL
ncbi:hypothetical protein F4777DRAFT_577407 [Nemania sp. FL0916]|nr:hypothetical protein F4777DRAFT_577407 [Nemania sp. FL0916]